LESRKNRKEFAKILGVDAKTLEHWEKNRHSPCAKLREQCFVSLLIVRDLFALIVSVRSTLGSFVRGSLFFSAQRSFHGFCGVPLLYAHHQDYWFPDR